MGHSVGHFGSWGHGWKEEKRMLALGKSQLVTTRTQGLTRVRHVGSFYWSFGSFRSFSWSFGVIRSQLQQQGDRA